MPTGRNKYQSRSDRVRIRTLFMERWDLLMVADEPAAFDEYDAYINEVYVMLMNQDASADDIAARLTDIAVNTMGMPPSSELHEASRLVAETLISWKPGFLMH